MPIPFASRVESTGVREIPATRVNEYDRKRLAMALSMARDSPDPSTQNGASLYAADGYLIGLGTNRPVVEIGHETYQHLDRDERHPLTVHAEVDAIASAYNNPVNGTLYCWWATCLGCARTILAADIDRLVTHAWTVHHTPSRWQDEVFRGLKLLANRGGIQVDLLRGDLVGECSDVQAIRFDGQSISECY